MVTDADKAIPVLEINIGDRDRRLACSMFVLWKFQKVTGRNPFEINSNELTPNELVLLLWCAMVQDEPTLTEEDVAKMMCARHLRDVGTLVMKLFALASPSADPEAEPAQPGEIKKN